LKTVSRLYNKSDFRTPEDALSRNNAQSEWRSRPRRARASTLREPHGCGATNAMPSPCFHRPKKQTRESWHPLSTCHFTRNSRRNSAAFHSFAADFGANSSASAFILLGGIRRGFESIFTRRRTVLFIPRISTAVPWDASTEAGDGRQSFLRKPLEPDPR
jgi:hypothetical protein